MKWKSKLLECEPLTFRLFELKAFSTKWQGDSALLTFPLWRVIFIVRSFKQN